jgi:hypothetical protein
LTIIIFAARRLPHKLSAADPLPVNVLKQITNELAACLTETFNRSLAAGKFPAIYKTAYFTPLLKKPGLDTADVRSYRPFLNLSAVSKLLERLISYLRPAYRPFHSIETAVVYVLSQIPNVADRGDISSLVMLDLSAVFETVDHGILLRRLTMSYGQTGSAHSWCWSYVNGRTQHVRLGSTNSSMTRFICGARQ